MNPAIAFCSILILGFASTVASSKHSGGGSPKNGPLKQNSPHPKLSIKSSLGVRRRGFSEGFSTVAEEWSEGDKQVTSSSSDHEGGGVVQEKSDGILDTLVLGLPVLFLPALLLALLYLVWAGSYSSYNYHNNYPNSFGTHGGPAVGFGHYGNGLKGVNAAPGHGIGKWRKTDRTGAAISPGQAYLAEKLDQVTPSVIGSIDKVNGYELNLNGNY